MVATRKFIVITTINSPSKAISEFVKWTDWQVVVVGDRKTPANWSCDGAIYLGMDEQRASFGELSCAIPENTYVRKMLGYSYAIRHGATAIFESDDDNIPYINAEQSISRFVDANNRTQGERWRNDDGWQNTYNLFGVSTCWPRGFPLEYVNRLAPTGLPGTDSKPWAVTQFLADGDPDVDAVYRMLFNLPIYFAKERRFILDEATFAPINSQATLWMSEAFPLLFLPIGVSDRVTDILRGYIASACLWRVGYSVSYSSPVVYQERNAHNLFNDFKQEIPLYTNADSWSRVLLEVSGNNTVECYRSAIEIMRIRGDIPAKNMNIYNTFLRSSGLI